MNPTVSIIIPTRNRAHILARALTALRGGIGSLEPPEVIVVDDCSSDPTPKAVHEFASASGWSAICKRQERPLGANAARNEALKIAHGEIIVFIDDDVFVTEGWLPKLLSGLSEGAPVTVGPVRLTVEGSLVGCRREEVSSYFAETLQPVLGLDGEVVPVLCNMAVLRSLLDQTIFSGVVRPPVEEIDWLRRSGGLAKFIPEALVWHYKPPEEIQLKRLLQTAWSRGSEGGWWIRECGHIEPRRVWPMAARSFNTSMRAFGHACIRQCWGGVVVGVGELSKALSLSGIINRDLNRNQRVPKSWR